MGIQEKAVGVRERGLDHPKENAPFRNALDESLLLSSDLSAQLPELEKLVHTGKLSEGLSSWFPRWNPLASKESLEFQNQLNEVSGENYRRSFLRENLMRLEQSSQD